MSVSPVTTLMLNHSGGDSAELGTVCQLSRRPHPPPHPTPALPVRILLFVLGMMTSDDGDDADLTL